MSTARSQACLGREQTGTHEVITDGLTHRALRAEEPAERLSQGGAASGGHRRQGTLALAALKPFYVDDSFSLKLKGERAQEKQRDLSTF